MNDTSNGGRNIEETAATLASQLERLPEHEARALFHQLTPAQCAEVIAELDTADAAPLLKSLPDDRVAASLQLVARNTAADLLADFPEHRRTQILAGLQPEKAAAVSNLLRYAPESAGGIMDNRFIAIPSNATAEQCLAHLRETPVRGSDDVTYIYVTDTTQKLVGVIALRNLVFSPPDRPVSDIMNPQVQHLRTTDDQEEIARLMRHTNFLGFPVLDEEGRLVGIVRMRDAIKVAQTEATEDMQLMVGLSGEERIWTRWNTSVAKRLPWLGMNMFTSLFAAIVVAFFEKTISRWAALVVFLPMISAVGGNAGMQALTVIVRGFALGDIAPGDTLRAARKELAIGLLNGVVLGLAIGFLAVAWKGSPLLGLVAGAAMMFNQVAGALSGVAVPFGLRKLGVDPALASSIFVTTITDIIGFLIFLSLAAAAIRGFGM